MLLQLFGLDTQTLGRWTVVLVLGSRTRISAVRGRVSLFCLALLADRFGICQDLLVRQHYLMLIPKGQDNLIRAELGKGGFPN